MHHIYINAKFLKKQIDATNYHNNDRWYQDAAGERLGAESGWQIVISIEKWISRSVPYRDKHHASYSIYDEWHYYGPYCQLYGIFHNLVRALQDIVHLSNYFLH